LHSKTIWEARDLLRKREVSSEELTRAVLERAERENPRLNAFIAITADRALDDARRADAALAERAGAGNIPSLLGVPLAVKDNICTRDIATTAGSRMLERYHPPYNAAVSDLLFDTAGAVLLGKTNLDEFAMGSSTEHSAFGPCRNPWDTDRIPGGSSGGSAAAVAADCCLAAVGSDTGGSIRQPASFCGVVGMKPTYGRISRYGLIAFASSLDQIGPLTKDVRDTAILLGALAGHDPRDSTCARRPVPDYENGLTEDVDGLRIGVPREYFRPGMDPEVERAVRGAIRVLSEAGARVEEISLPTTEYAVAVYYILATSEASSNLARYDGVHYGLRAEGSDLNDMYRKSRARGFGPEVKRRIMLGTYALSSGYYDAYYRKAQQVRTLIRQDFDEAFSGVDLIAAPTAPTPAFRIGEKSDDPLQMYLSDILTIPANLAGLPGISVPCGFTDSGLPIGLQLLGRPFDEETVLKAAYAYERSAGLPRRSAPDAGGEGAS